MIDVNKRRTWFRVALLLVAALLLTGATFAVATQTASAQETTTATTQYRLNLRAGPGLEYDVIQVLAYNTDVTFTGLRDLSGEWVQVESGDGTVGWVAARYLSRTPDMASLEIWPAEDAPTEEAPAAGDVDFSPAVVTATTTANLNLREGPGLGFAIMETLPQGTVVGFTGFTDDTGAWVQVDTVDGSVGWVAARYLSNVPDGLEVRPADRDETTAAESAPDSDASFSPAVVTATTTVNLRLREGPGLEYAIMDVLPQGTVVGFTGFTDVSGAWVQVDTIDGAAGWVAAQFLSTVPDDLAVWEGE